MVQYSDCPHCGNSNTAVSLVDVEIGGVRLKGIQCNSCNHMLCYFKDYDEAIKKLEDRVDDLEDNIED